jgi:hypothetical protein
MELLKSYDNKLNIIEPSAGVGNIIIEILKITRENRYSSNSIIIGSAKERVNIDELIFQWRTYENKKDKVKPSESS